MTEAHITDEQLASHVEHIRDYGLEAHDRMFLDPGYIIDLHDARNEIARLKVEIKTVRARALEELVESVAKYRNDPSGADDYRYDLGWNRALAVAITIIRDAAITEPTS